MYTNLHSHLIARELETRSAATSKPRVAADEGRALSVETRRRRFRLRLGRRLPTFPKPRSSQP